MTVAELIAELQRFPQHKEVGINDADTGYWAPNIRIKEYVGHVALNVSYQEMDGTYTYKLPRLPEDKK